MTIIIIFWRWQLNYVIWHCVWQVQKNVRTQIATTFDWLFYFKMMDYKKGAHTSRAVQRIWCEICLLKRNICFCLIIPLNVKITSVSLKSMDSMKLATILLLLCVFVVEIRYFCLNFKRPEEQLFSSGNNVTICRNVAPFYSDAHWSVRILPFSIENTLNFKIHLLPSAFHICIGPDSVRIGAEILSRSGIWLSQKL